MLLLFIGPNIVQPALPILNVLPGTGVVILRFLEAIALITSFYVFVVSVTFGIYIVPISKPLITASAPPI